MSEKIPPKPANKQQFTLLQFPTAEEREEAARIAQAAQEADPLLEIEELLSNPVTMLRQIADEIEAGEIGNVRSVAVVAWGDTLEVFGAGVDREAPTINLLFNAASLKFAANLAAYGEEE